MARVISKLSFWQAAFGAEIGEVARDHRLIHAFA
jgi:hypothetical protein